MAKFDRYLLSQLLIYFGFFSLLLVLVFWVNRAVVLFDRLIADGQSAGTFIEITLLTIPSVMRIVLPISAFVATVYATNRLAGESELVVVQATGYSPYRLARPVLAFGLIATLMISVLTHILVPTALHQLNLRTAQIANDIAAQLLTEGSFEHPADGITFYVREITPNGELRDIYLSDSRSLTERTTYLAARALIVQGDGENAAPTFLMFDGMAQQLTLDTRSLSVTTFEDFAIDAGTLIPASGPPTRGVNAITTFDLLAPSQAILEETGATRARMSELAHERISQALLAFITAVVGFAALMVGGFSRFGLWRQILGAIAALAVLKALDNAVISTARSDNALWPVLYLTTLAGGALAFVLLWIAAHPALFTRRHKPSRGAQA
ncbi:putative permease YjgP/YjgQ family protein [Aquimixticola soesokkakensis]|uniref:Putative permease YjgP/YjgQ family protein n=1 Tax=Aquimixticola soesokkakensis TaxID=1519096 RepID=A0A1Y5TIU9_9RHOB|nr:LPS export ABC transporter permease LptF [Aquimixticola soesokkakensis]SLN64923.1 putative permease YjgP/YjgQ family protein [Aquimixticola soesokkakensis]